MKKVVVAALCVALTGCSVSGSIRDASEEIVDTRRGLSSDAADAAEYYMCDRIPMDEWRKRYGTVERAAAWRVLCPAFGDELPVPTAARELVPASR